MRGLVVPDLEEDFTADPVELFFDLAFVFAFSQLVSHLVHHPTWTAAGEAALLFGIIWFAWSWFTWAANALSGNARSVRLVFLIATAITVPMAASVRNAFDTGGLTFALSGAVIMLMSAAMSLLAYDNDTDYFRSALSLTAPMLIGLTLLVAGGFADGSARVVLWILTVIVIFGGTVAAGSSEWIVRTGHFAERHGLILIIALGEVIVAIGISVVSSLDDGGLSNDARIGLVAAGVMACLLWWSYFDRVLPALEHRGEAVDGSDRGRYARDVYTWSHAPIIGGIITAAAAIEEALLHPSDSLHVEFRFMLAAGLLMYLGGVAIAVYRAFKAVAFERVICMTAIVVVLLIAGSWDAVVLLIVIDAVLLITLIAEHLRIEKL